MRMLFPLKQLVYVLHGTAIAITVTNTIDSRAYLTTVCCQEKWSGKYLTYRTGGYGPATWCVSVCTCTMAICIVYIQFPLVLINPLRMCKRVTAGLASSPGLVCAHSGVCVSKVCYHSKMMAWIIW